MSVINREKRTLAKVGVIDKLFLNVKAIWYTIKWFKLAHLYGFPIERRYDKDYIDWFFNNRTDLKKFKNIHEGQDCFILGNGPSLNKTDLNKLKDHYVFGLNKINLIFEKYPELKLSYHVTVNSLIIDQIQEELNENIFGCPSFISFVAAKNVNIKNENVYKLLTNNKWSFYENIQEPIAEGFTVTFVAMQLAFYMGFKNVYLVGVDHNFNQQGTPNEQQELKEDDTNHFHPDYFKGMHWHLADLEGSEASYALAKHQYHSANKEVYDATIDGKLTIFNKISFEKALIQSNKRTKL